MSEWAEGYITEIGYTHGYYRELSPVFQRFALLVGGFAPPPADGPALELGYGQGLSLAIHAAATPNQIWGTDFNPSHAAHAGALLRAAGVEARLELHEALSPAEYNSVFASPESAQVFRDIAAFLDAHLAR